jgi:hypothetical protein
VEKEEDLRLVAGRDLCPLSAFLACQQNPLLPAADFS